MGALLFVPIATRLKMSLRSTTWPQEMEGAYRLAKENPDIIWKSRHLSETVLDTWKEISTEEAVIQSCLYDRYLCGILVSNNDNNPFILLSITIQQRKNSNKVSFFWYMTIVSYLNCNS